MTPPLGSLSKSPLQLKSLGFGLPRQSSLLSSLGSGTRLILYPSPPPGGDLFWEEVGPIPLSVPSVQHRTGHRGEGVPSDQKTGQQDEIKPRMSLEKLLPGTGLTLGPFTAPWTGPVVHIHNPENLKTSAKRAPTEVTGWAILEMTPTTRAKEKENKQRRLFLVNSEVESSQNLLGQGRVLQGLTQSLQMPERAQQPPCHPHPSSPALRSPFPFLFDPQTQSPSFGSPGCWSCLWEGRGEHQAVLPNTQKLSIPGPSGLWTAAFLSGFF